jgi:hypothetical protein
MNPGNARLNHWLETIQTLKAPQNQIWLLLQPTAWKQWWPSVEEVFVVQESPAPVFGSTYQLLWKTPYGYSLATRVQVSEWVEGELIELRFCDGLEGFIRFALQGKGEISQLGVCWELASREAWISPAEMEQTLEALAMASRVRHTTGER